MSARKLARLGRWVPLWKRVLPPNVSHLEGNPQQRIYLPIYWMKLLKPLEHQPRDFNNFEVHPQMTKSDIKQYLEKIYKVDVLSVHIGSKRGEEKKHPQFGYTMDRELDKKFAMVQLKAAFEFPEIFKDKKTELGTLPEEYKKMRKTEEKRIKKEWPMDDIPSWFR